MAKSSNKNTGKKRATKLIKDKAIVNFLLEHMKPLKIDFSKIKIPSFLVFQEKEGEKNISNNSNNSNEIKKNLEEIKN